MKNTFKVAVLSALAAIGLSSCGERTFENTTESQVENIDQMNKENNRVNRNLDNLIAYYSLGVYGNNSRLIVTEFKNVADPKRVTIVANFHGGFATQTHLMDEPYTSHEGLSAKLLAANKLNDGTVIEFRTASSKKHACHATIDTYAGENELAVNLQCNSLDDDLSEQRGTDAPSAMENMRL